MSLVFAPIIYVPLFFFIQLSFQIRISGSMSNFCHSNDVDGILIKLYSLYAASQTFDSIYIDERDNIS
jgi:hypothetical protein